MSHPVQQLISQLLRK